MTQTFTILPQGAFALRESAVFGFGQRMRPAGVGSREPDYDGVMRLAFCLDGGFEQHVGVEVRQDDAGVHCTVHGAAPVDAVRSQVARVLSLDHDARGYEQVGERDAVIARLLQVAPGLRPPLFYSPYEAAVWAVLSARRPGWQMDRVRAELARAHGTVFELAGTELAALPSPSALLAVEEFPRIDAARLERIHGVARAAADGLLEADDLRAMGTDDALAQVQRIKGIGPLYAELIVIRACGVTDVPPSKEPKALELAGRLYGRDAPMSAQEFAEVAEAWRPWRTWCTVLLRAAGARVPGGSG